ncbi:hypothetical protein PQR53_03135 [Paraburkholderia fungorum]|uniref:hypothetical protein n=1 Tax=Paraburkholderia fungorum TaxID=134537 RepID=UPI0038BC0ADC
MRIAGAQFFDAMRASIQLEKQQEKDKNAAAGPKGANGSGEADVAHDGITAEDLEKSTLMGMLFPVPPADGTDKTEHPPTAAQAADGAVPKPGNSVDIYV